MTYVKKEHLKRLDQQSFAASWREDGPPAAWDDVLCPHVVALRNRIGDLRDG